jgi:hypothetical protein
MLSTLAGRLLEGGGRGRLLLRVTSDETEGPEGRSTKANHPGILSFARGVGCTYTSVSALYACGQYTLRLGEQELDW